MQPKRGRGRPRKIETNASHPLYSTWCSMRGRCNNPNHENYQDYGGRGISVCERWSDFWAFVADMGPKPDWRYSIGRQNNDGDYSPDNCSWELPHQQQNNRRNNRQLAFNGTTKTLAQWADEYGIPANLLGSRLKRMDFATAIALGPRPENPSKNNHKYLFERYGKIIYDL